MGQKKRSELFFDENIAPFLLFVLGLIRRGWRQLLQTNPPRAATLQRFALLKLTDVTETVLVSALVADIKKWKPQSEVTLIVGPQNFAYADLIPLVDHLIMLPAMDLRTSISQIRQDKYDVLLNCDSWSRVSAILGALARSRWVVGFMTSRESRHFADDNLIPHRRDLHELDNYRALLRSIGVQSSLPPLKPATTSAATVKDAITLNLWAEGPSGYQREWQQDRWKKLILLLSERAAYNFYLVGSPDQRGRNQVVIDQLPIALRARVNNAAGGTMEQIVRLIASSQLLVSVDTGFAHVGAAAGIPVVVLHGPTSVKRWGAVGLKTRHIASRLPGAGQVQFSFENAGPQNFLDSIGVDEVYAAAEKALGLRGTPFVQDFDE
ncbi:MAG: glycosyltransferase family 9 protein [Bdellovibrionaceae bacterium]|nr:glycosyltransferase family 9 protein [Pseudobdellovibrionaceae bacterium]